MSKTIGLLALLCLSAVSMAGAFWAHWDIWARLILTLRMTANFGMFLSVARGIFYWFIEKESLRALVPENLEAGVVLSDETWQKLSAEKELAGRLGARYSDGLSREDAVILKEWLTRPAGGATPGWAVYQTIPFAVWIFLGSLFTLVERKNLVPILIPHFSRAYEVLRAGVSRWLS